MPTKLDTILTNAVKNFQKKALNEITDKVFDIPSPLGDKQVNVKKRHLKNAFKTICPNNIPSLKQDIKKHFQILRSYIPYCSSPRGFRIGWSLRSDTISPWDADKITNEGGQLIPLNQDSRIFQHIQQGVELGPNKRLVLAVRHSEGNYDDQLDDMGRFKYQPPTYTTSNLRYRWCQYLAHELKSDYILLAVMWFKTHEPINQNLNHVFLVCPVKIIDYQKDLVNLDTSLCNPLNLQLITRTEAISSINYIFTLDVPDIDYDIRFPLDEKLSREYSFDKINNSEKGRQIKRWAQKTGKQCPGTHCKNSRTHINFDELTLSELAFGHIISQKWSNTFPYLEEIVHHPDNLYLTCRNCNSSLGEYFPDPELRHEIVTRGTIGDWIRNAEKEIKQS